MGNIPDQSAIITVGKTFTLQITLWVTVGYVARWRAAPLHVRRHCAWRIAANSPCPRPSRRECYRPVRLGPPRAGPCGAGGAGRGCLPDRGGAAGSSLRAPAPPRLSLLGPPRTEPGGSAGRECSSRRSDRSGLCSMRWAECLASWSCAIIFSFWGW